MGVNLHWSHDSIHINLISRCISSILLYIATHGFHIVNTAKNRQKAKTKKQQPENQKVTSLGNNRLWPVNASMQNRPGRCHY